jgi:hypothetical protein
MEQRILFTLLGILIFNIAFSQNDKTTKVNLSKELISILDTIHKDDQKYREESQELEKKYGWHSKEVQDLWKIIHFKDSINLIKVKKILNEEGWLGPDIIGEDGNTTLFLVIQHADTETQIKYLPMLREAVKNGNAKARHLAMLEDRILIFQGEKQIYGSQIEMDYKTKEYILSPMIDPDNVDQRRAEVGLKPIAEYLKIFNIAWDVEKFKMRMEEYELEKNKE